MILKSAPLVWAIPPANWDLVGCDRRAADSVIYGHLMSQYSTTNGLNFSSRLMALFDNRRPFRTQMSLESKSLESSRRYKLYSTPLSPTPQSEPSLFTKPLFTNLKTDCISVGSESLFPFSTFHIHSFIRWFSLFPLRFVPNEWSESMQEIY